MYQTSCSINFLSVVLCFEIYLELLGDLTTKIGIFYMHYWIYCCAVIIMTSGLFIMLASDNYLRKIIGLGIFQSAVLIFYIALAKIKNGIPPIDRCVADSNSCLYTYSNPLAHILMLTAIVVGFATFAVGLALIYRIYQQYNTISENEILLKETDRDESEC
ncbi:Cation:proton antiporter subunit C [Candidatus Trichorickettsia mobilis]|uniref:Cation:proton antiporter subunit C n=2 Tax=Candidatus Trichorickettsia mobilis TaxID=1346319 RepID=A0ABZ0UU66_9RICK|nr:Cation:proton antiporter subunit C [Candidatus Trichorickettsia mobilis]